ncbi:MAG: hypothetical protein ACE5D0_06235 [Fidelibacterota bacterium]
MIYLSFSRSHLLCTVWSHTADQSILTQISQIPISGDLDQERKDQVLFKSLFDQALTSIRNEVALDGHEVFITIPDHWVHHDFTEVDPHTNMDDSWDFIQWQKTQRFGDTSADYHTFAEQIQNHKIHVLQVPNIYISSIKLSLNEFGASPIWFGTESLTFSGSANRSFGVCSDNGSTYNLVIVNHKQLLMSSIRFIKGAINISNAFDFKDEISNLIMLNPKTSKRKLNTIYFIDTLSKTRLDHWSGFDGKHISPFHTAINETGESFDFYSYHLLAIQTMLSDKLFSRSKINFFEPEGIVKSKTKDLKKKNSDEISETIKKVEKIPAKKSKVKSKTKMSIDSNKMVSFLTVIIMFLALLSSIYLKNSDKILSPFSKTVSPNKKIHSDKVRHDPNYPKPLVTLMNQSSTMINAVDNIYSKYKSVQVSFISLSNVDLQLEIVNGEKIEVDLSDIGSVLNYSHSEIDCCGGFVHHYNYRLNEINATITGEYTTIQTFEDALSNLDGVVEHLAPIDKGHFIQTPFIVKIKGEQNRKAIFEIIKHQNENVLLRKVVIKTQPTTGESQTVFYISVFERKLK